VSQLSLATTQLQSLTRELEGKYVAMLAASTHTPTPRDEVSDTGHRTADGYVVQI
jgi:hypothetical protein